MPNQLAVPIDHLVINVLKKMDIAHDTFKQLGFTMTPRRAAARERRWWSWRLKPGVLTEVPLSTLKGIAQE